MPVSHNLQAAMMSHGLRGNYCVVHNSVNTDLFIPKEKSRMRKNIVHISHLDKESKNVEGILRVIARLKGVMSGFQLHIVGDGPDRDELETLAADLGLAKDTVVFHGSKTETEVSQIFQNADLLVLFSNFENAPCVISEAMSCGVPVVATKVGGIPEMIPRSELGIIIEPRNEDELFHRLKDFLEGKIKFDPVEIRKFAVEQYSRVRVGERINNIYQMVLK